VYNYISDALDHQITGYRISEKNQIFELSDIRKGNFLSRISDRIPGQYIQKKKEKN